MPRRSSDLEVVRDERQGLEVDDSKEQKIVVHESEGDKIWLGHHPHWADDVRSDQHTLSVEKDVRRQSWWGRPWSRTFKVGLAFAALVLVFGAIGGGVGGALASRSKNSRPEQELGASGAGLNTTFVDIVQTDVGASSHSLSMTTAPTSTTNTITYSTVVLPLGTIVRDCPSSNNSLYTVTNEDEDAALFRKICGKSFIGYDWRDYPDSMVEVNPLARSLDECIGMCVSANDENQVATSSGEKQACNSVCGRNGGPTDDFPYICFGGLTFNASGTFALRDEAICDSAAWVNQRL